MGLKDAQAFVVNLPTVNGLSQFGGFDMYLQDRAGAGHAALVQAQNQLLGKAAQNPELAGVHPNVLQDAPELQLALDRVQAQSMGFTATDVYTAIELMLAPVYVNDFFYQGRILRVVIQSDAPYRMNADAFSDFYLPSTLPAARASTTSAAAATGGASTGSSASLMPMVPLSSVVHPKWVMGSPSLVRFNGYSAIEVQGQPAPGKSSGEAMRAMERIITNDLPKGFSFDWAGQSLQEIVSGNQAPMLFTLSILVVFLCLAALYESWSIPVAVLLIVPLGVLGAVVAADVRGPPNDVYFKIGLITIIGLAAKNAILIDFAVELQRQGRTVRQAVVEAGRLRMRPILMTSFAFILGVLPLAISTGAGANSRHAIGTGRRRNAVRDLSRASWCRSSTSRSSACSDTRSMRRGASKRRATRLFDGVAATLETRGHRVLIGGTLARIGDLASHRLRRIKARLLRRPAMAFVAILLLLLRGLAILRIGIELALRRRWLGGRGIGAGRRRDHLILALLRIPGVVGVVRVVVRIAACTQIVV